MLTLALRERVAEGRVRGFCTAATGTAKIKPDNAAIGDAMLYIWR
jgi:hypothetical protein